MEESRWFFRQFWLVFCKVASLETLALFKTEYAAIRCKMDFKIYKQGSCCSLSGGESVELDYDDLMKSLGEAFREGALRSNGIDKSNEASVRIRYLESIADLLPASLFAKDKEGRYNYANARFLQMAGLDHLSQVVNQKPSDVFAGKRGEVAEEEDRQVLEEGIEIIGHENFHRGVGLENIWVMVSKAPVRNAEGEVIGIVGMVLDINDRKVAEEKLKRANKELERKNRWLEQDLNLARNVQQSLFPPSDALQDFAGADIAFRVRQSERLGGDFLQVKAISKTRFCVFICDVMGHGVQAAFITSLIKGLLGDMNGGPSDPGEFMQWLNVGYCESMGFHQELIFATGLYLEYDCETSICRFSNAGHLLPQWFISKTGEFRSVPVSSEYDTCAIGMLDDFEYRTDEFKVERGDVLAMCTDGLVEIQNEEGDEVGFDLLRNVVSGFHQSSAMDIVKKTFDAAKEISSSELQDDVSLIVFKPSA